MEPFEVIITFPPGQLGLQMGEIRPPGLQINGTINIMDDDGELNGMKICLNTSQNMYVHTLLFS